MIRWTACSDQVWQFLQFYLSAEQKPGLNWYWQSRQLPETVKGNKSPVIDTPINYFRKIRLNCLLKNINKVNHLKYSAIYFGSQADFPMPGATPFCLAVSCKARNPPPSLSGKPGFPHVWWSCSLNSSFLFLPATILYLLLMSLKGDFSSLPGWVQLEPGSEALLWMIEMPILTNACPAAFRELHLLVAEQVPAVHCLNFPVHSS